jgi:hypothetical protein
MERFACKGGSAAMTRYLCGQLQDMPSPRLKGFPLLGIEAVALIDADHTGSRARRVPQDCFNGLQIDAKLLQAGWQPFASDHESANW